jgi:seryl-tRNA synthetase
MMSADTQQAAFRADLIAAGYLIPMGTTGLYGLAAPFEYIVEGIQRVITRCGADQYATSMCFPAVCLRTDFERTGYLASFPNLVGAVYTFTGDDYTHSALLRKVAAGGEWHDAFTAADLMLVSAACQPAFPLFTGTLPAGGRRVDVLGHCFRREQSVDPARMQAFRQREFLYLGDSSGAHSHCEEWIGRGLQILRDLGLDAWPAAANDPFFGRTGRLLAANQRASGSKTELLVRIYDHERTEGDGDGGTAVVSCNYHSDHFGNAFGIEAEGGGPAHSSCVGFGLERLALALLRVHGLDTAGWPDPVREMLFAWDR